MKYKLLCIDIDGTLLNSEHQVTARTMEAVKRAQAVGVNIAISTGRIYSDAEYYARLVGARAPVIASNGAFIMGPDGSEILYKSVFGQRLAVKILDTASKYKAVPNFHTPYKVYAGNIPSWLFYHKNIRRGVFSKNLKAQLVLSKKHWEKVLASEQDSILKCELLIKDKAAQQRIRDELESLGKLEVVNAMGANLEITYKGVSKGKAAEILASYYNLTAGDIMAIGDSENDLSMIEYAGLGVAMGNAVDRLKEKADFITDTNDNEGVAKAIDKFILQGSNRRPA